MDEVKDWAAHLVVEVLHFLLEQGVLVLEITEFSAEVADVVAHSLHLLALVRRLHGGAVRCALHLGHLKSWWDSDRSRAASQCTHLEFVPALHVLLALLGNVVVLVLDIPESGALRRCSSLRVEAQHT